jgi:hypothetical protein
MTDHADVLDAACQRISAVRYCDTRFCRLLKRQHFMAIRDAGGAHSSARGGVRCELTRVVADGSEERLILSHVGATPEATAADAGLSPQQSFGTILFDCVVVRQRIGDGLHLCRWFIGPESQLCVIACRAPCEPPRRCRRVSPPAVEVLRRFWPSRLAMSFEEGAQGWEGSESVGTLVTVSAPIKERLWTVFRSHYRVDAMLTRRRTMARKYMPALLADPDLRDRWAVLWLDGDPTVFDSYDAAEAAVDSATSRAGWIIKIHEHTNAY